MARRRRYRRVVKKVARGHHFNKWGSWGINFDEVIQAEQAGMYGIRLVIKGGSLDGEYDLSLDEVRAGLVWENYHPDTRRKQDQQYHVTCQYLATRKGAPRCTACYP